LIDNIEYILYNNSKTEKWVFLSIGPVPQNKKWSKVVKLEDLVKKPWFGIVVAEQWKKFSKDKAFLDSLNFDQWSKIFCGATSDSAPKQMSLRRMIELANTFNEWDYTSCGSKLRQMALQKMTELAHTPDELDRTTIQKMSQLANWGD